jgi:hypothetical protein
MQHLGDVLGIGRNGCPSMVLRPCVITERVLHLFDALGPAACLSIRMKLIELPSHVVVHDVLTYARQICLIPDDAS